MGEIDQSSVACQEEAKLSEGMYFGRQRSGPRAKRLTSKTTRCADTPQQSNSMG
jgi:hypothetical protein